MSLLLSVLCNYAIIPCGEFYINISLEWYNRDYPRDDPRVLRLVLVAITSCLTMHFPCAGSQDPRRQVFVPLMKKLVCDDIAFPYIKPSPTSMKISYPTLPLSSLKCSY